MFPFCLTLEQLGLAWELDEMVSSDDEEEVAHEKTLLDEVDITKISTIEQELLLAFEGNISNIYNMSGCVVSDIQTRAEGESLYI
jgi:hypothetical protein